MRELRGKLDQEQARRADGKRIELSAMVLGNHYDNYQYGVDVRRLVGEGLWMKFLYIPMTLEPRKVATIRNHSARFANRKASASGLAGFGLRAQLILT